MIKEESAKQVVLTPAFLVKSVATFQSQVIRKLRANKNLSRIESDYNRNKPEVKLLINKNKAKDLGVSTQSIGKTLETLYGGKRVSKMLWKILLLNYLQI